jgi:hypothetical protein
MSSHIQLVEDGRVIGLDGRPWAPMPVNAWTGFPFEAHKHMRKGEVAHRYNPNPLVFLRHGARGQARIFYRFYLIPGMGHSFSNGTTNAAANPPLASRDQLYVALTDWVEKGIAPSRIDISTAVTATNPVVKSRPICLYPQKATFVGGDVNLAASYTCS